ncbi:tetratricopeptide repeat protein [Candidatus Omnitrophota bacterium]
MRRINLFLFSPCLFLFLNTAEARDVANASVLSHYIQAGIYERLNESDKAVSEYKAALKADYSSPHIHLRLAIALIKQNQLEQAADELKLAINYYETATDLSEQESSLIETHTLLALVYSLQGKIDEATAEYEAALRGALDIDPQNIEIHRSLAQVYLRDGRFPEAEKTYQFILSLAPSDAKAHFFLGTIYEEQAKRNKAIEEFNAALKINPEYPDALNSLGYLYAEESIRLKEAEEMIKKALSYEPDNGAYIDSLGWVFFKQGRYQEAIEKLEQAIQFLSDPVIYEHLGDAYLKQNNALKAKENWQKSLGISSSDTLQIQEKLKTLGDVPCVDNSR